MTHQTSHSDPSPVEPSVKGTAMKSVVEDVQRLIAEGVITPEDLTKELASEDLELLDDLITAIGWYPLQSYARLMELLARKQAPAGEHEPYFIARGYRAAEALLGGTYRGLDVEPGTWGPRAGEVLIGLSRAIYNFGSWRFRAAEPGVYEIEGSYGIHFPDPARFTAQGFLNFVASRAAGRPVEASSRRPDAHRVVYRLTTPA